MEDAVRRYRLVVGSDQDGDSVAIHAVGELDLATVPVLEEWLWQAFEHDDTSPIVVDLTGVTFIDAAAMRILIWAATRSRENGNRLRIRSGHAVRGMLKSAGIEHSLPLIA